VSEQPDLHDFVAWIPRQIWQYSFDASKLAALLVVLAWLVLAESIPVEVGLIGSLCGVCPLLLRMLHIESVLDE